MLRLLTRWKGKCAKHPRFNPEKEGEGGIKGNCPHCALLVQVFQKYEEIQEHLRAFDQIARVGVAAGAIKSAAAKAAGR